MQNQKITDLGKPFLKLWITKCQVCDWTSSFSYARQDECQIGICPKCGSDEIVDFLEFKV